MYVIELKALQSFCGENLLPAGVVLIFFTKRLFRRPFLNVWLWVGFVPRIWVKVRGGGSELLLFLSCYVLEGLNSVFIWFYRYPFHFAVNIYSLNFFFFLWSAFES
jgi:hypothetical protein